MASFAERMIGAAKLDSRIYEEVEADESALGQAMGVVALAAIASGIGSLRAGPFGVVGVIVSALVAWFIWAVIVYVVGTKLFPEPQTRADVGQLLRTIGFAASPGLLAVFGILPFVGLLVRLAVSVWQLAAMVVAVRQALDYTTTQKAVIVCVVGWLVSVVLGVVLAGLFGGMAMLGR